MHPNTLILRYGEIFLKKGNRHLFERQLLDNIKQYLAQNKIAYKSIIHVGSRIVINDCADTSVRNVFGLTSVSPALRIRDCKTLEPAKEHVLALAKEAGLPQKTFRITCYRHNKDYYMKSQEIAAMLGEHVINNIGGKVNLKQPEVDINIEIIGNDAYLFVEHVPAYGGLPVGSSGKVVSLISGGIDSPVASWLMMRRGCNLIFVHFSSYPQTSRQSEEKVKELVQLLTRFQFRSTLYIVPLLDIQKKMAMNVDNAYLVILYRRAMLRIAEVIMRKEGALALCTGDNLGQVASQTLPNMVAIESAITTPVLRPLLTYDKMEIVKLAKEIGTYDISAQPHEDCCSLFVPQMPETRAKMEYLLKLEEKLKELGIEDDIKIAIERAMIMAVEQG